MSFESSQPHTAGSIESASPGRAAAIVLAVVGAAAVGAPLLTSGTTVLPPPRLLGATVVVALAIALLVRSGRPLRRDSALAVAVGVAASAAHLEGGAVLGHDIQAHAWVAWAWLQAWSAGDLHPIWLHHVGLGLPFPLFYGPIPYHAMAPAALLGLPLDRMVASSFVLAGALAAFAAHAVVGAWTADRRAALVAATALAYAPYRLLDANYRCALGEVWGVALLPFALYAFDRLFVHGQRRDLALAAVSIAALAITYPPSLLLVAPLLPIGWLVRRPPWRGDLERSTRAAARALGASVAGLALAGFFLLPQMVERGTLRVSRWTNSNEGSPRYAREGLHVDQLVARQLWSRLEGSIGEDRGGGRVDEMPFYAGLVLLGALAAALAADRLARRPPGALFWVGAAGLGALALSLHPIAELCARLPGRPLVMLTFPWRFLGAAAVCGALALGLLVADTRRHRFAGWLAAIVAAAAVADGFAFSGAVGRARAWHGLAQMPVRNGNQSAISVPQPWPLRVYGDLLPPRSGRHAVGSASVFREYLTLAAERSVVDANLVSVGLVREGSRLRPIRTLPYARALVGKRVRRLRFERSHGSIEVHPSPRDRRIEVAEQYFPGWQVEIDGRWQEVVPNAAGLLAVELRGAAERVRFRFFRWRWDRLTGWLVTCVSGLALVAWSRAPARRGRDSDDVHFGMAPR